MTKAKKTVATEEVKVAEKKAVKEVKKAEETKKEALVFVGNVKHNGKMYKKGDVCTLSGADLQMLQKAGLVK